MTIQHITSSPTPPVVKAMENVSGNILFRIQALVCRINTQLSRLSQETQSRSQTMKREYRVASNKSADLQYQIGKSYPIFAGVALFAAAGTALASPFSPEMKDLLGPVCGQLTSIQEKISFLAPAFKLTETFSSPMGQFYSNKLSSEQLKENSTKELRNTEISAEANKSGEARDLQQELQQILANIRDLFKKASS